jgi:thiamine transporter
MGKERNEEEQEMDSKKLIVMVEIAMMSALAFVFSLIKFGGFWPQGGSVSLVMIPIIVLAFRRGLIAGLIAGLVALRPDRSLRYNISIATIGILIATSFRLLSHYISGIVWFGEYAPEGMPVHLYSFLYNVSYLVPEIIISLTVVLLLVKTRPQMFRGRTARHS